MLIFTFSTRPYTRLRPTFISGGNYTLPTVFSTAEFLDLRWACYRACGFEVMRRRRVPVLGTGLVLVGCGGDASCRGRRLIQSIKNTSAASSTTLGLILIFTSCLVHRPLVCTHVLSFEYMYDSYGCCQGEHQQQTVINDNGRYHNTYFIPR